MRSLLIASLLLVLSLSTLFGADIGGKWSGQSDQGPTFTFTLKAENNKVTGAMIGEDNKDYAISEGKLDGENISFIVNTEYQGNAVKLVVKGEVREDSIKLHIATDDQSWSTDVTLKHAVV